MSRSLRLKFSNALYSVTARGNEWHSILPGGSSVSRQVAKEENGRAAQYHRCYSK